MKSALKTPYPVFLAFILLGSHYHCPFYCISTTLKRSYVALPPSPPFLPPSPVTINLVFVSKDLSHLHILNKLNTHPPIIHDGFFHLASCFKGLSIQHALVLHSLYGRRISQNSFFSAYLPVDRHLSLLSFDGYGVFCKTFCMYRSLWGLTMTLSLIKFSTILPSPLLSETLTMATFLPGLESWVWEKLLPNWLSNPVSILDAHWDPHSQILIWKTSDMPQ